MIAFEVQSLAGSRSMNFEPSALVIAGWTGRDPLAVDAHVRELEALGVARPRTTPIFYRVSAAQLTGSARMQVVGREASGEVEAVLFRHEDELYVGLGSDHTDRKLEAIGVTLSKQVCSKPVGPVLWPWREVEDHWDDLVLRALIDGGTIYQEGATSALRRPDDLLERYEALHGPLPNGGVMFCGTLPARGGVRFAQVMELELADPTLGRTLRHVYQVEVLTIAEDTA